MMKYRKITNISLFTDTISSLSNADTDNRYRRYIDDIFRYIDPPLTRECLSFNFRKRCNEVSIFKMRYSIFLM